MTSIANDVYSSLGLGGAADAAIAGKKEDALGQADFLRLMTEQLKHQDPLKPMENSAFLGQLAQFSSVQGLQDLNKTVNGFAGLMQSDQILRGTHLIGREVLVPSGALPLDAEGEARGVVAAPGPGMVTFEISDANGQKVRELNIPAAAAGELAFSWDGNDASGARLPPGNYSIAARHVDAGGEGTALATYARSRVQSVSVGNDGLYLDLHGIGTAPIGYVLRVI
ncbi:flagellar hook capping FlgD N-terminal domain-containing protein [Luteimonas granuli]|uniref:Basal-body rod modification protein FlgD n=1 Tax=Luteimonas granuli TaxID=1176533 RepID=A0A518N0X6_9GAMM|nr:flagellar hook capping FlgD N-terminal domain-containing protein [Luteimonas granuli]QDW65570.1 flagellar basal body rod modification protein [Luteimonas granuli]